MDRKVMNFQYKLVEEIRTTSPATVEHIRKQMMRGHSFSLND